MTKQVTNRPRPFQHPQAHQYLESRCRFLRFEFYNHCKAIATAQVIQSFPIKLDLKLSIHLGCYFGMRKALYGEETEIQLLQNNFGN